MGLKKYEIITVGSDKRVRALRSWQVGDRYVNIGDVGGIVYDEKTLSQDGACWLFRGNFGFPGARIGGDSIVDVAETTLSTAGAPAVDILGSSVVVGSKLQFAADQTTADAVVLTADDFEQGLLNFVSGANWEAWKVVSNNFVRTKAPIFIGGAATTLKIDVPGFEVRAYVLDRDGVGVTSVLTKVSGAGVTLSLPAGYQYFVLALVKNPFAPTVPADATTAAITFTGTYETKLSVIDSRVEINPATSTGTLTLRPGGTYTMASGAKYPEAIIRNSKVAMMVHATANRTIRFMGQLIGSTATLDATASNVVLAGTYSSVKSLTASGELSATTNINAYNIIQATDCDNFTVSPTIFPGLTAAQTANMPFIFQRCNVPGGIFYHHAQIANTYKNIDFALASVDLGKAFFGGTFALVSSEVDGMYRLLRTDTKAFGCMVESYESVRSLVPSNLATTYGTTIYADAYFNGLFDFAGTNVFGNKARSHPLAQVLNVQPRAVQGTFNTAVVGETITGVVDNSGFVCVPTPFRVNGPKGLVLDGVPSNFIVSVILTDMNNVVKLVEAHLSGLSAAGLLNVKAFIRFRKSDNSPITPADLAGVTVTVYNGCKIVNTGETAVNMKGNIRVEDNATLVNASVVGSGYFGGEAVASGLLIEGSVFMSDNASFTKTAGANVIRNLKMTDNGVVVLGDTHGLGVLSVSENARLQPTSLFLSDADLIMSGNAAVTSGMTISGILRLEDDARITTGSVTAKGDITLCGSYNQTASRTWTGKRVIDNENAPEYSNNVKTQYDF